MAPPSQKDLPIGLVLTMGMSIGGFSIPAPVSFHLFSPRPEDVQYAYSTRGTIIQTFDGGFVDDFGEGLVDILVSGTTGWRGGMLDGMSSFVILRELVVRMYHKLRAMQATAGLPIENVKLYWVDSLNLCVYEVYPLSFTGKKNKQRPLMYQYTLRMTGIKSFGVSDIIGGLL